MMVAVRVTGPPGPSATKVHVDWPGSRPPMFIVKVGFVSYGVPEMPKPLTRTDVALAVDHDNVALPPIFTVLGDTLRAAVRPAPGVTVTVAVRVTGPPLPCAVRVNVWVPAASPLTVCVPLNAALANPGPLTKADVAFAVLHVSVVDPGAVAVVGLAASEPDTVAAALTVKVAVCVIGPPAPCAVSV